MGTFIKVTVNDTSCSGLEKCEECIRICPVNIFEGKGVNIKVKEENEDECILCGLCTAKCDADAISIKKLYEF